MIAKFKKSKKISSHQTIFFPILLGMILLLTIGFLIITNLKINQRRTELISRIETLKKEIQILEEKNAQLKAGVSEAGTEEYLEKVAREQLGLKSPGEEVVVIKKEGEEEKEIEKEKKSFLPRIIPEGFIRGWQRILEKLKF